MCWSSVLALLQVSLEWDIIGGKKGLVPASVGKASCFDRADLPWWRNAVACVVQWHHIRLVFSTEILPTSLMRRQYILGANPRRHLDMKV
jgi:hypothetical protein